MYDLMFVARDKETQKPQEVMSLHDFVKSL